MESVEQIKVKIAPYLRRSGVIRSAVFGSFAKGVESAESDVDILVEFEGEKSLLDLAALKLELERVLNKKVDVITYQSLSPLFRDRVLSEQIPIYG